MSDMADKMPDPISFAHNNFRGLRYITCGHSQANVVLICLHGWCCRAQDYLHLFRAFEERKVVFRAIAVDLPGHGETPTDVASPSIQAFGEIILAFLTHIAVDATTFVLAGHSMSCRIVLETWTQAQIQGTPAIRGLVFLDGSNFRLKPTLSQFDREDPRKPTFSAVDAKDAKRRMFERMLSERTPEAFKIAIIDHIESRDRGFSMTLRQTYLDYDFTRSDDALREFHRQDGRLLSLQSTSIDTSQGRVPMKTGEVSAFMAYIKDMVPGARQIVVPDSAHFPHVDSPDLVADQLVEFMRQTSDAA